MPRKTTAGDLALVQSVPLKSGDVRAELKQYFPHPEFGVVFEVAQATGFNAHRHIDALVMDLWPSRGLRLKAVEIKVSRGDWRREKREPAKAEQIARFCDEFWVAAPKGIVPLDELPGAWGLLEVVANGKGFRVSSARPAQKTKAEPLTREFLAGIMRAANRPVDPETLDGMLAERRATMEAQFADRVKERAAHISENNSEGARHWAALMDALEMRSSSFDQWFESDAQNIRRLFKAIKTSGVMESWHGLASLQATLGKMKNEIDKAMTDLSIPEEKSPR